MSNLSTSPLNPNTPASRTDARLEEKEASPLVDQSSLPTGVLATQPTDASQGLINTFKRQFRVISLNIRKIKNSTPPADLPENATPAMIHKYLNQWVKESPNGENRLAVRQKIMRFLSSPTNTLQFLRGEPLPPLFHTLLIKNKLRTLEIHEGPMAELPESIGQLLYLEHLRLMHCTQFTRLPACIGNLHALQTLQIQHCPQLQSLPEAIEHLTQLHSLILIGCTGLRLLPTAFGALKNLEHLILKNCMLLESLPPFDDLTRLSHLEIQVCPQLKELPSSLYTLALQRPPHFLPDPWDDAVSRMRASSYTVNPAGEGTCLIRIHRDTTVPFAQEHLQLLIDAMSPHVPTRSLVIYRREDGSDGGGLSREFWSHLMTNIARQTEHDRHPILTDSGEGHYVLRQNGPMTAQHLTLCQNIGKLLSALLCGLAQNGYKLGHVFPQHFYAGLLAILRLPSPHPHSFATMPAAQARQLCYDIAREVKGGMFFNLPPRLQQQLVNSEEMDPHLLHRIWQILNVNMDRDAIDAAFPTMKAFIGELCIKPLADFATEFRKSLNPESSRLIERVLLDAAYESYSQEAVPLVAVAHGFMSRFSGPAQDTLHRVMHSFRDSPQTTEEFVDLLEGTLTPEAFINYINDSIDHFLSTPRPASRTPLKLARLLQWLREWCHDAATTDKMQAFLCFVYASPTIPLHRMDFKYIRNNPNDFRTQQIRAHTCSASLDLPECISQAGEVLPGMTEAQAFQKGKETFILALEAVIATPHDDRFNMN